MQQTTHAVLIGYFQAVGRHDTEPGAHRQALADGGCEQIVAEATGEDDAAQPELEGLIGRLQPGDVLFVPGLGSLARSLSDLASTLRRITAAGAGLHSLAEGLEAGASQGASPITPSDEAAAALGRPNLQNGHGQLERVDVGQPATPPPIRRRRGGRPPKLSAQQQGAVLDDVVSGRRSAADMARRYRVSEATISRLLAAYRAQTSAEGARGHVGQDEAIPDRIAGALPIAALDERLAIVGTSGSGKTYAAKGLVERLLEQGARVCVVDPLGVWWGLRAGPDGGASPLPCPVVVFGGRHADVALDEHMGWALGHLVGTHQIACVVDVSDLGSAAARRGFMTSFTGALYASNTEPLHLVLDEADLWAPQRAQPDGYDLLGRVEEIVRRGRVRGFVPWLITQRPAVLHKDVLSQADILVSMKLTSSQDREAIGRWIEGQADRAEGRRILAALPRLARGEGWVWAPSDGVLEKVAFPRIRTLDSSATPRREEKVGTPGGLAPVDLATLTAALAGAHVQPRGEPAPLAPDGRSHLPGLERELRQRDAELAVARTALARLEVGAARMRARLHQAEVPNGSTASATPSVE